MAHKQVGICLLGCGTVGGGVVNILTEQREMLRRRTGLDLVLRHVVVKDTKDYPPGAAELPMCTDAASAIDDPASDIVVELIGGTGVAGTFVRRALSAGKPVVSANKALLASQGVELFALARQNKTCIAFEASVGGGIPIIDAICRGLAANRVDALVGIVNGTCNFILSQMTQNGSSYAEALKEAQKLGFAEANPAMDVEGRDAAQKLAILAGLAFDTRISEKDIYVSGIGSIDAMDIRYAGESGYVIKLLAIAERKNGALALRVHPTLVHKDDVLADVSGSFNAISVFSHALGHALWYGRGAGRMPTASAVVADIISVAQGIQQILFDQMHNLMDVVEPANLLPFEELRSRYYIRLTALDQPGVLAAITAILGRHQISVASIQQHESAGDDHVPVVITTHSAREGDLQAAIKQIDALPTIVKPTMCIRILEQPKEFAGQ